MLNKKDYLQLTACTVYKKDEWIRLKIENGIIMVFHPGCGYYTKNPKGWAGWTKFPVNRTYGPEDRRPEDWSDVVSFAYAPKLRHLGFITEAGFMFYYLNLSRNGYYNFSRASDRYIEVDNDE